MDNVKWTVSIIYQYYNNSTEEFFYKCLVDDINGQDNHSSVKYFLLKHKEEDENIDVFSTVANGVLTKENETPVNAKQFYESSGDTAINIWANFLGKAAACHAEKDFLITVGHADGFAFCTSRGIASPAPRVVNFHLALIAAMKLSTYLLSAPSESTSGIGNKTHHFFDVFKTGNKNGQLFGALENNNNEVINDFKFIPVSVLAAAINTAFNGKKLSFLYFGNCFIQNVETGYLLKDSAEQICASEGAFFMSGTNYKKLFSMLGSNIGSNKEIAKQICDGICEKLTDTRLIAFYQDNSTSDKHSLVGSIAVVKDKFCFSVNNTSRYEELKTLLSDIASLFIDNTGIMYNIIRRVRTDLARCQDVSGDPLGIIDCKHFFTELVKEQGLPYVVRAKVNELIAFMDDPNEPLLSSWRFPLGSSRYRAGSTDDKVIFPAGVSIFFPRSRGDAETDISLKFFFEHFYSQGDYLTPFLSGNKWKEFVIGFYNNTPPIAKSILLRQKLFELRPNRK